MFLFPKLPRCRKGISVSLAAIIIRLGFDQRLKNWPALIRSCVNHRNSSASSTRCKSDCEGGRHRYIISLKTISKRVGGAQNKPLCWLRTSCEEIGEGPSSERILVRFSGRGDKDVDYVLESYRIGVPSL
ncbi:hypothetical protein BDV40DRAFT_170074 [Aspergillus tamarii]|uniref:Uncharacterized protein n=1 Tax=Aspergillus tamarii TaxID=41984 RepID=A0A5N6V952_ASPTM|nr:hypothetical protein BDV40DRAFT_170074 [Aspergillus tamarii]